MTKKICCCLILLLFAANFITAKSNYDYLLSITIHENSNSNNLENLSMPNLYQYGGVLISACNKEKIEELNNIKAQFKILDQNPDLNDYSILSSKNYEQNKNLITTGQILFKNENFLILKNFKYSEIQKRYGTFSIGKLNPNNNIYTSNSYLLNKFNSIENDSTIAELISNVNADSVAFVIQSLQDFGSRFLMTENRFAAAEWIKNRFLQLGFTDVKYDTFMCHSNWGGIDTNTIQHNVIATLPGTERPDDIYIIGGHYDSFSSGNIFNFAPGADDNASGSSAALECARIIKETGYQPEATLKFICFAAEELMYFGDAGSEYYASEAANAGMNIKLYINNDMISHSYSPVTSSNIGLGPYTGAEDVYARLWNTALQFTTLTPVFRGYNGGGDPLPFFENGYKTIYVEEDDFSPFYHSPQDIISNYNMDYCAEVIKLSSAALIKYMISPAVVNNYNLSDVGNGNSLSISWSANSEDDIAGYYISVGQSSGNYTNTYSTSDTSFLVQNLSEGTEYFIGISAFDNDGNTSVINERSGIPYSIPTAPAEVVAEPDWNQIKLSWLANPELDLAGYNIYRSTEQNGTYEKMNNQVYTDTVYIDTTPLSGVYYFYIVKTIDTDQNESIGNLILRSRAITMDHGILLVDETSDGDGSLLNPSDGEVDDFYHSLLTEYTFADHDVISKSGIDLADLAAYSTIIWHGDDLSDQSTAYTIQTDIQKYLDFGGNLFYSGYKPSKAFHNTLNSIADYSQGDFIFDYLKIESADKKPAARFIGAENLMGNYNSIYTDTTKTKPTLNFHLTSIESIAPSQEGTAIYKFDSDYDTTSLQGSMKGLPVAVEYLGQNYKSIVLSFPLYYINLEEAKTLMNYILTDKFNEVTEVVDFETNIPSNFNLLQNYPNPFNPNTKIKFTIPANSNNTPQNVTLIVYDLLGNEITTLVNEKKHPGEYQVNFEAGELSSGIYFYRLTAGSFLQTKKMTLIK